MFVYTVFQTNSETRTASNNLDPVLVSEQLGEESLHQDVGWARVAPELRPQHLRQAGDSGLICGECLPKNPLSGMTPVREELRQMGIKSRRDYVEDEEEINKLLKFLCLAKEMSMSPFLSTPNPLIFADLIKEKQ